MQLNVCDAGGEAVDAWCFQPISLIREQKHDKILRMKTNEHFSFQYSLQGSSNSYAIKKKDELERVAKSNR